MAFLTILERRTEARARAGHGDHESPAHQRNLKRERDPRVPARGRGDVRTSFARHVCCADNARTA
jgi:hypothetical protein